LDVYKSGRILGRKHTTINLSGSLLFVSKICSVSKGKFYSITGHEGTGGGDRLQLYSFVNPALDGVGGKRQAPAALPPRKRPGTHCPGGWVGPRAGLNRSGESRPHRDSTPGRSSP